MKKSRLIWIQKTKTFYIMKICIRKFSKSSETVIGKKSWSSTKTSKQVKFATWKKILFGHLLKTNTEIY